MRCDCKKMKTPCEHLEKLMPHYKRTVRGHRVRDIESVSCQISSENTTHSLTRDEFDDTLAYYGIDEFCRQVILARFMDSMSYREIAKEFSLLGYTQARELIKSILRDLKERGYR